jgi:hypothetical protein
MAIDGKKTRTPEEAQVIVKPKKDSFGPLLLPNHLLAEDFSRIIRARDKRVRQPRPDAPIAVLH